MHKPYIPSISGVWDLYPTINFHQFIQYAKPNLSKILKITTSYIGLRSGVEVSKNNSRVRSFVPLVTDIDQRSQNLRHLYPSMGLKLGVVRISRDQNNHDSSSAYALRSERENKHEWNAVMCTKIMDAFCLCFRVCGQQKPE